jgi:hypothetical protein
MKKIKKKIMKKILVLNQEGKPGSKLRKNTSSKLRRKSRRKS